MSERCDPEEILKRLISEEEFFFRESTIVEDECMKCTLDFLTEYFGIATANKATDEQLHEVFDKTVRLNESALLENNFRLGAIKIEVNQTADRLERVKAEGDQKGIDYYEPILKRGIQHLSRHQDVDRRLQGIHDSWKEAMEGKAPSRLDVLLTIERFANLSHDHGPALTEYGCRCPRETVPGKAATHLTNMVLECLAEKE